KQGANGPQGLAGFANIFQYNRFLLDLEEKRAKEELQALANLESKLSDWKPGQIKILNRAALSTVRLCQADPTQLANITSIIYKKEDPRARWYRDQFGNDLKLVIDDELIQVLREYVMAAKALNARGFTNIERRKIRQRKAFLGGN